MIPAYKGSQTVRGQGLRAEAQDEADMERRAGEEFAQGSGDVAEGQIPRELRGLRS